MKTKLTRVLCCTLCIVTLMLNLPLDITESAAASTSEIDKLEQELDRIEQQKTEYENKIKDIESSSASALEQKSSYEEQIALLESKISYTQSLIAEYDKLIADNESSVDAKNAEYDAMFEKVKDRLRIRYEAGISNHLVYIMESQSFTDFLVNMERTADIVRYDRELMDQITKQKQSLDTDRALLEQYKAEQEKASADLNAEKASIDEKKANLNSYIAGLEADQKKYEQMLIEAEKKDEELNNQLKEALRKLAEKEVTQHPVNKDALIWPVSINYSDISSPYGWRTIWGRRSFHYGIDIPAPAGSNVYAAQSGVVEYAQWHDSYGNFVIINHGGGYTTLYAHNTSLNVVKGQTVNREEIIAFVGTTGSSTGNHCHFEVRYYGEHKNPLDYVTQP